MYYYTIQTPTPKAWTDKIVGFNLILTYHFIVSIWWNTWQAVDVAWHATTRITIQMLSGEKKCFSCIYLQYLWLMRPEENIPCTPSPLRLLGVCSGSPVTGTEWFSFGLRRWHYDLHHQVASSSTWLLSPAKKILSSESSATVISRSSLRWQMGLDKSVQGSCFSENEEIISKKGGAKGWGLAAELDSDSSAISLFNKS